MPLSAQTIMEMQAGALTLAKHASKSGIEPEYMEAMIRTQQRAKYLQSLHREGLIRIERVMRPQTSNRLSGGDFTIVHVGEERFEDPSGELTGAWPSEVLVAQVALALAAGQGDKEKSHV